jgi:hypothetical protein
MKLLKRIIWELAVLVLLIWVIYKVNPWDGFGLHDMFTKFHEDCFRNSANIKGVPSKIWEAAVLALLITEFIYCAVVMAQVAWYMHEIWWR